MQDARITELRITMPATNTTPTATIPRDQATMTHCFSVACRGAVWLLLSAALSPQIRGEEAMTPNHDLTTDPHSLANPAEVRVTHLSLELEADFANQQLRGTATWQLDRRDPNAALRLDTRDLVVERVTVGPPPRDVEFRWGPSQPHLGRALIVPLDGDADSVSVHYQTSPGAQALQWLAMRQTAGGQHPFMFTQSQAILARTWVPCQDSPGVRTTYEATIRVPPSLMAVMSATNPQRKAADGTYRFEMQQPIPSYLLALAIGDLEFRAMGTAERRLRRTVRRASGRLGIRSNGADDGSGRDSCTARTAGNGTTFWCCHPAFRLAAWRTHG